MFKRKQRTPNDVKIVIDGAVYHDADDRVWIKSGRYFTFYSDRAFDSWKLKSIQVPDLYFVDKSQTLGFRDGSLIQSARDGAVYFIYKAERSRLTSPLEDYGFDWSDVVEVSEDEVQFHPLGSEI